MVGRAGILSETLLLGVTKSVSLVRIQSSPMRNEGETEDIRVFTWAWPRAGSLPSAPAHCACVPCPEAGARPAVSQPGQGQGSLYPRAGKAQGQLPGPALGMGKKQLSQPRGPVALGPCRMASPSRLTLHPALLRGGELAQGVALRGSTQGVDAGKLQFEIHPSPDPQLRS